MQQQDAIRARLAGVKEKMNAAAERSGRDPAEVKLVAVTKTWPAETVMAAYGAGVRDVGENRAEELSQKRGEVQNLLENGDDLVWHQIGTLQSRKTKLVAQYADTLQALDRQKIAKRLAHQLQTFGRSLPVYLEVNLSGEKSKSGFALNNWEHDATQREAFRNEIETIAQLPNLTLTGLMTMAPWGVPEEEIRSVFRRTKQLSLWLQDTLPDISFDELSMGMTDDFEIAIEEGSTIVRIGRAIFGSRG